MRKHQLLLVLLLITLHVFAKDKDPRQQAYYQVEYRRIPLMVKAY